MRFGDGQVAGIAGENRGVRPRVGLLGRQKAKKQAKQAIQERPVRSGRCPPPRGLADLGRSRRRQLTCGKLKGFHLVRGPETRLCVRQSVERAICLCGSFSASRPAAKSPKIGPRMRAPGSRDPIPAHRRLQRGMSRFSPERQQLSHPAAVACDGLGSSIICSREIDDD